MLLTEWSRGASAAGRGVLTLSLGALLACGGGAGPRAGSERAPCFPNDTCDEGLTCLSSFCVHVVVDGGGAAGTKGDASSASDGARPGPDGAAEAGATVTAGAGGVSGTGGTFVPAAYAPLPQVATMGGTVLTAPKVQPIVFAGDDASGDIVTFLSDLTRTGYWKATTSEYGVGALTVLPAIMIPSSAPLETTDALLRAQLTANTSGFAPAWGAADPSVIYLFVIPEGSTVDNDQSTCCDDFGGYHYETPAGNVTIPYAVGCACPGFFGITVGSLDERTTAISHELVEAATDPFPKTNPAYQGEDPADAIWGYITGGEVADMCAFDDDATFVPTGSKYMVQRSWSNTAARRPDNPCVPKATASAYFNSFPVTEPITLGSGADTFTTHGVSVPLGLSKTIDVQLYSTAATPGPWTVSALDYDAWVLGAQANLKLALDKSEGQNGDVLHLTISSMTADSNLDGAAFILISHYGGVRDPNYQTNLTMTFVTN
jgi:hypothetical protein